MKKLSFLIAFTAGLSNCLLAQIQINGAAPAATYCEGTELKLSYSGATASTKYQWSSGEIKFENDKDAAPKFTLSQTGSITIKLTMNDTTIIPPVTFTGNPKPTISGIKSMIQGSNITVVCFDNFVSGAVTYTWKHPDGVTTSANPLSLTSAAITKQGEYQLEVKNIATSCISTYKHKVPEEVRKASEPVFGTPLPEEDEITFNFIIRRQVAVNECTINGDIINNSPTLVPPRKSRFTLIEQKEDYSIVKFWDWDASVLLRGRKITKEVNKLHNTYNGTVDNPKFFRVANDRFGPNKQVVPYHSMWIHSISFTAGTLIVPIKLRRTFEKDKKFDFSKDFSLGGFIGLRTRISHFKPHYLNLGVSLGITSVTAFKENSDPNKVTETKDLAAFSWAGGCIFEFDRVQVALLRGRDILSHYNFNNTGWIHNNTTWFGVGFGYAILSRPDKIVSSKGNNSDAR
jgi:hypothetical protein